MQLELFLVVLAAILVRDVAAVAVNRTVMWFAMAPLTPDELEKLAQTYRGLDLEHMSDGMIDDLGRRCMQERMRRSHGAVGFAG